MIEFKESQKMAEDSKMLSYALRKIILTEENSFLVYHRPDRTSEDMKKFLDFYRRSQALDDGADLDFKVAIFSDDALCITGNLNDALVALKGAKLISEKTSEEILHSSEFRNSVNSIIRESLNNLVKLIPNFSESKQQAEISEILQKLLNSVASNSKIREHSFM